MHKNLKIFKDLSSYFPTIINYSSGNKKKNGIINNDLYLWIIYSEREREWNRNWGIIYDIPKGEIWMRSQIVVVNGEAIRKHKTPKRDSNKT